MSHQSTSLTKEQPAAALMYTKRNVLINAERIVRISTNQAITVSHPNEVSTISWNR